VTQAFQPVILFGESTAAARAKGAPEPCAIGREAAIDSVAGDGPRNVVDQRAMISDGIEFDAGQTAAA
jgi:hypothetical protein